MKKAVNFFKLAILSLVIGLGIGYVTAEWTPPGGPPTPDPGPTNTLAPINVGPVAQIKEGPLSINNNLWITSSGFLFADTKVGVGGVGSSDLSLETAKLDINGQIRIRNTGATLPTADKVLTAADVFGLATWSDPPETGITQLTAGTGITFNSKTNVKSLTLPDDTNNPLGYISIYETEAQKRVSDTTCATGASAIKSINVSGTVNCQPVVTQITAGPGLSATMSGPGNGVATVGVNLAASSGLKIDASNKLLLDIKTNGGLGIGGVGGNQLMLRSDCDSGNPFLKWNGTSWACEPNPAPPDSPRGGSVLYIRRSSADPQSCPGAGLGGALTAWQEVTRGSGLNYTSEEDVGGTVTQVNRVRVCYKTDQTCQTLRLTSKDSAIAPPSCPVSFYDVTQLGNGNAYYAPGGLRTEYQRVCFKCY